MSTCCQSVGIPSESSFEPPPHRSPASITSAPHRALDAFDSGPPLNETSIPVAGKLRWVERWSAAAGLPACFKASCSAAVRNPEIIRTFRPVRRRNLIAATMSLSSTSSETPQRCARAQQSELTTSSRAGTSPVERESVAAGVIDAGGVVHRDDTHITAHRARARSETRRQAPK